MPLRFSVEIPNRLPASPDEIVQTSFSRRADRDGTTSSIRTPRPVWWLAKYTTTGRSGRRSSITSVTVFSSLLGTSKFGLGLAKVDASGDGVGVVAWWVGWKEAVVWRNSAAKSSRRAMTLKFDGGGGVGASLRRLELSFSGGNGHSRLTSMITCSGVCYIPEKIHDESHRYYIKLHIKVYRYSS